MAGEGGSRDRLGEMLVASGQITEEQLADAHALQRERGLPLGQLLVEMGILTRLQLAGLLTEQWGERGSLGARVARTTPPAPPVSEAPEPVARSPEPEPAPTGNAAERLDGLEARLLQLERTVERLAEQVDDREEAAPRQEVEDLRLALRELWKVQKSLLERGDAPPGASDLP